MTLQILQAAAAKQEESRLETLKLLQEACVSGDLLSVKSILSDLEPPTASALVNHASSGSNTLLFKASEHGHREIVSYLIENGADGRIHPVTKYSPLYIAAYNGRRDVVEALLRRFPELIAVLTVEKWSPLHAACINGHAAIFEYILRLFPFRRELLKSMRDKSNTYAYEMAFDVNQRDVTGQTILYLATCVGNLKIVEMLLGFKVKAKRAEQKSPTTAKNLVKKGVSKDDTGMVSLHHQQRNSGGIGSTGGGRMGGIQALISKLRGSAIGDDDALGDDEIWLSPLDLDIYCNNGTETALHCAVKRREHTIATKLLTAGANPNLVIYAVEASAQPMEEQFYFKGSTCLVEACKNRDMGMIDLLLKYSVSFYTTRVV